MAGAAAAPKFLPPSVPEEAPPCIKAEMRDYQIDSLKWITRMYDNGVSCILGDEMGLGKTLQTIAFLAHLKFVRGVSGPFLVVVPLSVISSWMEELSKWCPDLRAVRLHSSDPSEVKRLKQTKLSDPSTFDIAVTTYEMAVAKDMSGALTAIHWRVLILDEGQRIKNEETQQATALRRVHHQFCLLLSGTPLQNNLHEFYALLSFLLPEIFQDSDPFDHAFNLSQNKVDNEMLEKAHHVMRLLCLRRLKAHINLKLPPKLETRINCPLTEMQLFWYRRLLLKNSGTMLRAHENSSGIKVAGDSKWTQLKMLLVQLRKVANHPYKFPGAEPDFDGTTSEDIVEASGKIQVLDQLLKKLFSRGHRVVLFSQFNMMLDIIEDYCLLRGFKYLRLDGSTNRIQRRIDMALFNKSGSDIPLYLLNTRAGGLGINLQTADTCILFDSDWNPQVDIQAMARVHRIGQAKPVHIYRLFCGDTVEERILQRADKKLYLDKMVNRDFEDQAEGLEKLGVRAMLEMLQFGADKIFRGDGGRMPSSDELDIIMDRSAMSAETKPAADALEAEVKVEYCGQAATCLADAKLNAADFGDLGGVVAAPLSSYVMGGVDYRKYANQSMRDLAAEWKAARPVRERSSTVVNIDGHMVSKASIEDERQKAAWSVASAPPKKKSKTYARFHSEVCQLCWDGGDLFLCDHCPSAYHAACLGVSPRVLEQTRCFSCPRHRCASCDRTTQAAGGMLFRCDACPHSYCEDCLPDTAEINGRSERAEALGESKRSTVCYITCDSACAQFAAQERFTRIGVPAAAVPAYGH